MKRLQLGLGLALLIASLPNASTTLAQTAPSGTSAQTRFPNPSGEAATLDVKGSIDSQNPFFQSLGSNGRACATCHVAGSGWTLTPSEVQARFDATQGLDPLFRTVDGSNSPKDDVSTVAARRIAYSVLLNKGLIRVGLALPAGAEFTLRNVDDPYHFASAQQLSLFRRPLPTTNLRFLTTVMWDGRESSAGRTLQADLTSQALDATRQHAQLSGDLSASQLQQIVDFESSLYSAQIRDNRAGDLTTGTVSGGPQALSLQAFTTGSNEPFGGRSPAEAFNPRVFSLFASWAAAAPGRAAPPPQAPPAGRAGAPPLPPPTRAGGAPPPRPLALLAGSDPSASQAAIARGEAIFNNRPFTISDVPGLTDTRGGAVNVTCSTCHNAANVGSHTSALLLNIGTTDASRRTPDLPLYTLHCTATGQDIRTSDPGQALVTGKCADIGKFQVPVLRNLAARQPYFHNGSASTLNDVVDFYRRRFGIRFGPQEAEDLAAFLAAL